MNSRPWIPAVIACLVFATNAPAQPAPSAVIDGVYNGTYSDAQGPRTLKLALQVAANGALTGVFTFYVPPSSHDQAYSYNVGGSFDAASGKFNLRPLRWLSPPPERTRMTGLAGTFEPASGRIAGTITGGRGTFEATRDPAESENLASVAAATKEARAPALPVAQPEVRSAAAKSAAAASPAPRAPGAFISRTEIDGVYAGTFGSNPDDKVPAKIFVKFIDNGSVNGVLDGLLTFDVPPSAEAKPVTYTYKLIGVYATGSIHFWSAQPVGPPPPNAYAVKQIYAEFDRTPYVKGPNGQLQFDFIREQISGKTIGSNGLPSGNKIEAKLVQDESANLDRAMAAAQASAGSAVSTSASPAPPAATVAAGPGPRVVRPNIVGVFNGTYTRANEPPTKLKLTITRTPDGLAGVATIYLPTDSGPKAYTYSLKGAQDGSGGFHLMVYDWETTPPKDFKDFKAMGFKGELRSNVNQNTARILSVQLASRSDATFFIPTFEATWDATESANIRDVIAAQKAVGDADQIAALKAQAEVLRNAKPRQLASKDLVRKSQAYWDSYRSDFIREVFDGGFAGDVDDDPAFQSLFIDYVDLFSKNCAAYLPADHKTVTITTVTTTTYPGGAVDTKTTSKTVEIDSRFIPKYVEFSGVDPAPGSEQEKEQTAKIIAIAGQIFHRPGPSHGTSFADANALLHLTAAHGIFGGMGMDKFFATEVKPTGPSAALRQMGENLLRGATGEPSLQEAGAKIAGAEAETDKNLPAGRFARFVDAAHAFYREPANERLKSRFETAFDETLAAKYRGVMTRDEEYYYANDFENRFRNQIMQPREKCTDPNWPLLHPVVEECIAATQ